MAAEWLRIECIGVAARRGLLCLLVFPLCGAAGTSAGVRVMRASERGEPIGARLDDFGALCAGPGTSSLRRMFSLVSVKPCKTKDPQR